MQAGKMVKTGISNFQSPHIIIVFNTYLYAYKFTQIYSNIKTSLLLLKNDRKDGNPIPNGLRIP